jgi:hypothetical protein
VHFSRSLPSNSWWQTMVGCQVLSRPSAAEGGGRRPAFTGPATQPYSATEVDGWQRLSRVSQNRAAVHQGAESEAALCNRHEGWQAVRHRRYLGELEGPGQWPVDQDLCHHHDRRQRVGRRHSRPHAADPGAGGYARWLGEEPHPADLMRPFPADLMRMWPISTRVNKPENDDPSIVEPIEPATNVA